jgi:hypothetical protein
MPPQHQCQATRPEGLHEASRRRRHLRRHHVNGLSRRDEEWQRHIERSLLGFEEPPHSPFMGCHGTQAVKRIGRKSDETTVPEAPCGPVQGGLVNH